MKRKVSSKRSVFLLSIVVYFFIFYPPTASANFIISFGDSITQGHPYIQEPPHGARVGGYEPELERLTDTIGNHYDVLNYGYGGELTSTGISRLSSIMKLQESQNASRVLILEGANDVYNGISPSTTIWNLAYMVDNCKRNGVEPVLGTLTPIPYMELNSIVKEINIKILKLGEERNIVITDHYNAMVDDWIHLSCDILHPNEEGYKKMAATWFENVFCNANRFDLCNTPDDCYSVGGYWYNEQCNTDALSLSSMLYLLLRE